jgi:hypothetical protein
MKLSPVVQRGKKEQRKNKERTKKEQRKNGHSEVWFQTIGKMLVLFVVQGKVKCTIGDRLDEQKRACGGRP